MSRSFSCTNTGLSVLGGFVSEGELAEISADHVEFDLDIVEGFSVVDSDVGSDHFGEDNGISQMGLDGDWLFSRRGVLLGLFALGVEAIVSVLDFCIER